MELVDPPGQAYPAVHDPLHAEAVRPEEEPYRPVGQGPEHNEVDTSRPGELPKRPAGQAVHDTEPAREYFPTGHTAAVELVDPAGQAYPAVQLPEHAAVDRAAVLP